MNSPLEQHKAYEQPSVFTADGLLREARRQKNIPLGAVTGNLSAGPGW